MMGAHAFHSGRSRVCSREKFVKGSSASQFVPPLPWNASTLVSGWHWTWSRAAGSSGIDD